MRSADGEHDRVRERACAQSLRAFTSGGSACVWRDAARSPQRIRCVAQLVAVHRERVQGAALAHHARARRRLEWRRRLGLSDRVRARALSGRVRSAAPSAAAATAAAVAAAAAHAHQGCGRGRRRRLDQLRRARPRGRKAGTWPSVRWLRARHAKEARAAAKTSYGSNADLARPTDKSPTKASVRPKRSTSVGAKAQSASHHRVKVDGVGDAARRDRAGQRRV